MVVLDKFLNFMKLGDEDEGYEDDDYYDEDDSDLEDYDDPSDAAEEPSSASIFKKHRDQAVEEGSLSSGRTTGRSMGKVMPMHKSGTMEVKVIRPNSQENSREIADILLQGTTVILNLEGLDLEVAQRIIDFTAGATYALQGNLQKISNHIILVVPNNVEISGDISNDLSGLGGFVDSSLEAPHLKMEL